MKTNNLLSKIMNGEEISQEEKIKVCKWVIPKHEFINMDNITADEKIEIARELVAKKVADILEKQMVISRLSWKNIDITLWSKDCTDPDANIEKFLAILWAQDIKVTSDFPWYCETYEWTTRIKFKF